MLDEDDTVTIGEGKVLVDNGWNRELYTWTTVDREGNIREDIYLPFEEENFVNSTHYGTVKEGISITHIIKLEGF